MAAATGTNSWRGGKADTSREFDSQELTQVLAPSKRRRYIPNNLAPVIADRYSNGMVQDHFERHNHGDGVVDWNFNVVFNDQPSVAAMAEKYRPLLEQPYFYAPIPAEWLHATILRVGTTDEYSEEEMLRVADRVQERLKDIRLPKMHFDNHMVIHGNACFKIEPESELEKLWLAVDASLQEVVGPDRTRKPPYGKFIAHTSLVYSKQRDNEADTERMLREANIEPATFYVRHMPLIKQRPINGHYEWEVVRDIAIG